MKYTIYFSWIIDFIVAYFYDIKPDYEYTLGLGFFLHGPLVVWNWIISWFDADKLCKAPLHTDAYNFFWWFSAISAIVYFIIQAIALIIGTFLRRMMK